MVADARAVERIVLLMGSGRDIRDVMIRQSNQSLDLNNRLGHQFEGGGC
jgi:hypothetical protein